MFAFEPKSREPLAQATAKAPIRLRPPVARRHMILQRKATVSEPGDAYEREADEVADKVMRMADPGAVGAVPVGIQRKCAACEEEEEKTIPRAHAASANDNAGLDAGTARRASERGGEPLPTATRDFFEPRFGKDFGQVRVQVDDAAARAVKARAYTVGQNIVFGRGEYAPATREGKRLIAHELAHVVQQRSGVASGEKAVQRKPIKESPLSKKLVSVSLKHLSKPKLARQDHKGSSTIDLLLTRPLEVEATAQFASAEDAAGLTFGFFQLGRPYELYRATMHKLGADPSSSNDDLNLDLTTQARAKLPLPDHAVGARFFKWLNAPDSATADANGKVTLKYRDLPSTPFAKAIEKDNTYYGLSGIAAQSFFFTAFGAWDGKEAIILATFYWDMKHCEVIQPGDVTSAKSFGAINVAPFRYCTKGGCDLGEPGADQFGQPAKDSFVSHFSNIIHGSIQNPGAYAGPSTFTLGCQSRQSKGAKRGQNE